MKYIPALKYHWATPFYDWFIHLTMPENWVKQRVIDLAEIKKHEHILDFGCGTGTLLLMLYNQNFKNIKGVDIDDKIIEIAKNKFAGRDIEILKDLASLKSNSYDKVLSTWVFHHLTMQEKEIAMKEIHRILKVNGLFVMSDWGIPQNLLMKCCFFVLQLFDNFTTTNDNKLGKLPILLSQSGFENIIEVEKKATMLGTLKFWIAAKQAN